MPTARTGFRNLQYHYEETDITLDAAGTGTAAIVFDVAYDNVPVFIGVPPISSAGTITAASLLTTGFTLTMTTDTDHVSSTIRVPWFTHEKP